MRIAIKSIPRVRSTLRIAQAVFETCEEGCDHRRCVQLARIDHGNRRAWRFIGSTLTRRSELAKMIFEYPDDVTLEECQLMDDVAELLEKVVDQILIQSRDEMRLEGTRIRALADGFTQETKDVFRKGSDFIVHVPTHPNTVTSWKPSFLYLMRHNNGLTKIGSSVNPKAREKTLQAEDPRLSLIDSFEAMGSYERKLHSIFHDRRVRGEWFDLDSHHVDWVRSFFSLKVRAFKNGIAV